jgi:hypothetical protein
MVFLRALLVAIWAATSTVSAAPSAYANYPIVTLDSGTFIGTTANGTNRFLGIPFAQPPCVVDFGLALHPSWLTLQPTELVACASVCPKRLIPT